MGGKAIILYTPTTWPGGSQFLRQYKGAIQKVMRVQLTSFHLCSENPVPESVVENINSISSCLRGGERCKIRGNVQRSRHFALHLPGQEASQGWKCMPKSSRGESCGTKVQNAATDPASADLSDRNTVELWRKPLLYDTSPTRLFDVHNVVLYPLTRLYLLFFWSD